jgi:RNA ligase (TIGR02306 family)
MMSEFHVQVVKVGDIERHPNADTLSLTRVHGGYPVIFRTGDFKPGDLAVYIPIETTLPATEQFAFLKDSERKRLRAKKLRGIFSMGLLIPAPADTCEGDDVCELMGITKWEAPIDMQAGGENEPAPEGWHFPHYTDIEGLRRHPDVLTAGEEVVITEKLHGASARYVHDGERLWVGSRTCVKRDMPGVLWWEVAREMELAERLALEPKKVFFGEVFGQVQDLKYGHQQGGRYQHCKASFRVFDVFDVESGRYLDQIEAENCARVVGLTWVPTLYRGSWNPEMIDELAEGRTTILGADNVREGFVIKPIRERYDDQVGRVILKMHGQGYLLRKQRK